MSPEDEKVYCEVRPYIRGVVALLVYLRFGPGDYKNGFTPAGCFNVADDLLTEFEKRRSA